MLAYTPLAAARLDRIDEALIDRFIQWKRRKCKPATVNRCLATLRRMLRLAAKWKLLDRVPCIELLPGEGVRDYVLSREAEKGYLAKCPEPLRAIAQFGIETGLRIGEVLALRWPDVSLDPVGAAGRGFVRVRQGKSQNAKRTVPLTAGARDVLMAQGRISKSEFVFVREDGVRPVSRFRVAHQHTRVRNDLNMASGFVIHSFRHTMLTRLGEAGVDAFTIMRIAGHSTIVVSQRYVHPVPETIERAIDRLEAMPVEQQKAGGVPTNLPTVGNGRRVAVQ